MSRSKDTKTGARAATQRRIFISYRRSDSAGYAGRLYDYLKNYFGDERIFFDVDTIRPGVNFELKIAAELDRSDAMLVMIGNQWLDSRDPQGNRRLEEAHDYVRYEIETALGKNIEIIPVLLQGTPMPSSGALPGSISDLSLRNAVRLNDDHWSSDCRFLAEILKNTLEVSRSLKEQKIRRYRIVVFSLSVLVALLAVLRSLYLGEQVDQILMTCLTLFVVVNVVLVTYLLATIKRELDRLSWIIIAIAILACLMISRGGYWTLGAAFMMVLEAGLLNFVQADE
ncbi:MAG: toll/interleukin-1 receptor domain-containing protein [Bacteroidota bacterium]